MQFHWHLHNGMHENVLHLNLIPFCDEQTQVAVRDPALIATSLKGQKSVNSLLQNIQSQSKGEARQTFLALWKLIQPA